jgi:hypothetical protein
MTDPKENSMRHPLLRSALRIALLLLVPATASADPGETGFAFLKLGVGARAMGLGSAYVAIADDPTAVYWNPAGLAAISKTQVTAMHNEWIQDFRQEFVAVGAPAGPGSLGISFSGFYADEFERRDDTGVLIGHFGFNDIAVTGAYGMQLAPGLDGGLALRYVREMIDEFDATAFLVDVGARYRLRDTGVSFGGAVQNLGGDSKFISESFPTPVTWRVGAAGSRDLAKLNGRGTLTAEVRQAKADDMHFHVGAEYAYREHLALRMGGKFGYDDESLSFGLGLAKDWFHFDYALVPLTSDLGTTHFFSVTGVF